MSSKRVARFILTCAIVALYAFAINILGGVIFTDGLQGEETLRSWVAAGAFSLVVISVILFVNLD
jgi:hypothetical protein